MFLEQSVGIEAAYPTERCPSGCDVSDFLVMQTLISSFFRNNKTRLSTKITH
jgi:hypothetical protein